MLGKSEGGRGTGMFKSFTFGNGGEQAAPSRQYSAQAVSDEKEPDQEMTVVDRILSEHDIVVFSSNTCPYCTQAISALKEEGYDVHVVERNREIGGDLFNRTGKTSVPSAWVKGTYIGGCNDGPEAWMGVIPCIRSGKIDELLGQ